VPDRRTTLNYKTGQFPRHVYASLDVAVDPVRQEVALYLSLFGDHALILATWKFWAASKTWLKDVADGNDARFLSKFYNERKRYLI
jgi:hypothetical protein